MIHPKDGTPAVSSHDSAGALQDGPAGTRPDALPAGPLAVLHRLADLWDRQASEAGVLAGYLDGAARPEDLYYLRGQAADREECAAQLRNLLGRLADEQAAADRAQDDPET